jgi:hypothetical protein
MISVRQYAVPNRERWRENEHSPPVTPQEQPEVPNPVTQRGVEHSPTVTPEEKGEPLPPDPYPEYRPVYGWVFQAWVIMFLAVICIALVFFLLPYLRTMWDWMVKTVTG